MARRATVKLAPQAGATMANLKVGGLYLICFDSPLVLGINVRREVRHYLGASKNIAQRLRKHASNPDARILQLAKDRGITWRVVRVWLDPESNQGTRWQMERRLKGISGGRLCPCCHPGNKRGCLTMARSEVATGIALDTMSPVFVPEDEEPQYPEEDSPF